MLSFLNDFSLTKEEDPKYDLCTIILFTAVGSIGGVLLGYDLGIIAGAQLYFKDTWPDITV